MDYPKLSLPEMTRPSNVSDLVWVASGYMWKLDYLLRYAISLLEGVHSGEAARLEQARQEAEREFKGC